MRKQGQVKYCNISAKDLSPLSSGDVLRLRPTDRSGRWYKASVEQHVDVRSYDVRTEDGLVFRTNLRHLRSSKEAFCASTNPVADSSPGVAPTNLVPPANPISGESSTSQEVHDQLPTDATELVAKKKLTAVLGLKKFEYQSNRNNKFYKLYDVSSFATKSCCRNDFSHSTILILCFSHLLEGDFEFNKLSEKDKTESRPRRLFAHYYLALLVGLGQHGKKIGDKSGDYIYI